MDKSRLALFKEHYFFELDRKHKLTSACALPSGILTVLAGTVGFYLQGLADTSAKVSSIAVFFLLLALTALIPSIYFLIRAYHNHTYKYLRTPKELTEYHEKLLDFHSQTGGSSEKADQEFDDYVLGSYGACCDHNTLINESRSMYLHSANTFMIAAAVFVLISAIPYFFGSSLNRESVHKVELVGPEKVCTVELFADHKREKLTKGGTRDAAKPTKPAAAAGPAPAARSERRGHPTAP